MTEYRLGEAEAVFADIIWKNEPLPSRLLAELAEQRLNWKRTSAAAEAAVFCIVLLALRQSMILPMALPL